MGKHSRPNLWKRATASYNRSRLVHTASVVGVVSAIFFSTWNAYSLTASQDQIRIPVPDEFTSPPRLDLVPPSPMALPTLPPLPSATVQEARAPQSSPESTTPQKRSERATNRSTTRSTPSTTQPPEPPEPEPQAAVQRFVDLNCNAFSSREEAQAKLEENSADPHNLDTDNDGRACELRFPPPAPPPPPPPPPVAPAPRQPNTDSHPECQGLNVADNALRACNIVMNEFPAIDNVLGRGNRPGNPSSCHPSGRALDFMVSSNAVGDEVAAFVEARKEELEVFIVIWEEPDHFDHVHVSFDPCRG